MAQENCSSQTEKNKSQITIEIDNEESGEVVESLNGRLNKLSSNLYGTCIYRVSEKLRKANEAAYTPRLVSIGPLHHGLDQLRDMEACKLRFLNNFLIRFGIGLKPLVDFAAKNESSVRGYYEDTAKTSRKQFKEMIVLDGIFIVELFLENHFLQLRDRNEMVFENKWMYKDLLHDLLLLENQLPIIIMENLLCFVDFSLLNKGIKLTIHDLAKKFFKDVGNTQKIPLTEGCKKARHFVEFLLILHAPREIRSQGTNSTSKNRSATELHEAGLKFQFGEGNCLFEVELENGVLTVPKLTVNDTTESFFRNLIAFEQCGHGGYYSEEITSYVRLMDSLIDTSDDVDLLQKSKIIKNELGESQKVADLFNNLYKEVPTEANVFYFDDLCKRLDNYRKDTCHSCKASCFKWRLELDRNYFSSPWVFTTFLGAGVLLTLTVIQTICSILQVV